MASNPISYQGLPPQKRACVGGDDKHRDKDQSLAIPQTEGDGRRNHSNPAITRSAPRRGHQMGFPLAAERRGGELRRDAPQSKKTETENIHTSAFSPKTASNDGSLTPADWQN